MQKCYFAATQCYTMVYNAAQYCNLAVAYTLLHSHTIEYNLPVLALSSSIMQHNGVTTICGMQFMQLQNVTLACYWYAQWYTQYCTLCSVHKKVSEP